MKTIHREDVKAALRKRYGSIENFATLVGMEAQAVRDLLRGKSNAAKAVVAKELGVAVDHLTIVTDIVPVCGANSSTAKPAHRQNAGAK